MRGTCLILRHIFGLFDLGHLITFVQFLAGSNKFPLLNKDKWEVYRCHRKNKHTDTKSYSSAVNESDI